MTTLGPESRVWIGWPTTYDPDVRHAIGQTGTVNDGPIEPGTYVNEADEIVHVAERSWNVRPDIGGTVFVAESILFPLDDGEPARETDDHKVEHVETT